MGRLARRLLVTLEAGAKNAHFSPDSERIVAASYPTRVWDSRSGKFLTTLVSQSGQADTIAQFDSNGARILTTTMDDATAHVWNSDSGKILHTLQTPGLRGIGHVLYCARFSPDCERIVTVADDRKAWVWEASGGAGRHSARTW